METHEYEIMYRVEDQLWWYCALRQRIDAALQKHISPALKILDIGCGTGALMKHLSSRSDITGIDFSSHALRFCRERGLQTLAQADAASLPFTSDTYDAAIACDLLYHAAVPDPLRVLLESRRVLKPSGVFIMNVPAYNALRSSHDTAVHTARRFTRSQVVQLLQDANMVPLQVNYWNTLLFPVLAGIRLFRRCIPSRQSDLATPPSYWTNNLLKKMLQAEHQMGRNIPLPFGLSIFAVAQKK